MYFSFRYDAVILLYIIHLYFIFSLAVTHTIANGQYSTDELNKLLQENQEMKQELGMYLYNA